MATYYVSTTGVDSAGRNGSIGQEWLTLGYAVTRVSAGNTIHMNAGTYTISALTEVPLGVSLEGDGDTSILNITFTTSAFNDGAITFDSNYNPQTTPQTISNLKFTGNKLTGVRAIVILDRSNITVNNCTFDGFNRGALFIRGFNGVFISGITVHDCTFTDCGVRSEAHGVLFYSSTGALVYSNTFNNTGRTQGSNGNPIGGNINRGLKIYNNTFTKPEDEGTSFNFFIELWFLSVECEIYNNIFYGNASVDVDDARKGTGSYSVKIHHNRFYNSAPCATSTYLSFNISIEQQGVMQDVYIYNNYSKYTSWGIYFIAKYDSEYTLIGDSVLCENLYVYNNIIEDVGMSDYNAGSGVYILTYDLGSADRNKITWDNVNIWNNTIRGNTVPNECVFGVDVRIGGTATNINIQNNILEGFVTNPISIANAAAPLVGSIDGLNITNNCFYNNGTDSVVVTNITPTNYTNANNITSNPLFVSTSNFHLQAGSPAINAGVDVGLTTDYDGKNYNNPPSIGAYEFSQVNNPAKMFFALMNF